jgi:hypothetical protein
METKITIVEISNRKIFFHKAAYSKYNVPSEMLYTELKMLLYLDHYEFSRKHHKYRDPQAQQTED